MVNVDYKGNIVYLIFQIKHIDIKIATAVLLNCIGPLYRIVN